MQYHLNFLGKLTLQNYILLIHNRLGNYIVHQVLHIKFNILGKYIYLKASASYYVVCTLLNYKTNLPLTEERHLKPLKSQAVLFLSQAFEKSGK